MRALTFTNSQSPIHDFFVEGVAEYLSRKKITTKVVTTGTWDEREAALDAGAIDMGWICGAPYVKKIARGAPLELLAAPVMQAPRYQNRPVYFSDVVVRADARFQSFDDLRGARWAYNEKNSHSGYHVVRYFLATHNRNGNFFGRIIKAGAHQKAVAMLLRGAADAAALDSIVLEMLYETDASLKTRLRVIETIGPSPMPPLVIGLHIPSALREQIRNRLLNLNATPDGQKILWRANMARLAQVNDADYDAIREMLRIAEPVSLTRRKSAAAPSGMTQRASIKNRVGKI